MKNKKVWKTWLGMSLATVLAAGNVMCFPASAYAYSRCTDTWTAQLEPTEISSDVTSPLLAAGGQFVYINERNDVYEIEIPMHGGDTTEWELQVVSKDPDWLRASIGEGEDASESMMYLKVETGLVESEEEMPAEEVTEEEETPPEEERSPEQVENLAEDMTSVEGCSTTTEGEEDSTTTEEEDTTTEEEEDSTTTEEEDTTTTEEEDTTTTEEEDTTTEGEEDSTTEEEEDTTTEGDDTIIESDTTIEMPDTVSAEVILSYGETKLSATFVFPMKETEEKPVYTGTLVSWPEQYHPSAEFSVTNGDKVSELYYNKGEFPPMTKYVINQELPVVLYDGGTILLPADAVVRIDLSQTELNKPDEEEPSGGITEPAVDMGTDGSSHSIELSTAGNVYEMIYTSGPVLEKRAIPYILNEQGMILPIPYMLGEIEPTIWIEHLMVENEELMWEPSEGIAYQPMEDGNILLKAKEAPAGTYRATIFWIDNNLPIYILKTAFFIQYDSVDQGGTK